MFTSSAALSNASSTPYKAMLLPILSRSSAFGMFRRKVSRQTITALFEGAHTSRRCCSFFIGFVSSCRSLAQKCVFPVPGGPWTIFNLYPGLLSFINLSNANLCDSFNPSFTSSFAAALFL